MSRNTYKVVGISTYRLRRNTYYYIFYFKSASYNPFPSKFPDIEKNSSKTTRGEPGLGSNFARQLERPINGFDFILPDLRRIY
jgi:hypothetical protein